jgi:uncharacterized protein
VRSLHIAVIGSGISGLSAAWLLSHRHKVTLIEAENRLGGHANTVDVVASGQRHAVDTGFIVSNTWTYPNFTALMDYLNVPMVETQMTFSVSSNGGKYEYSGHHLGTLLGHAQQWVNPSHWRMMFDLVRFYRTVESDSATVSETMTLGQYLKDRNYADIFVQQHLLPICAAIWSSAPDMMANCSLHEFVRFFANHKLFILGNRPNWRTVKGGSREYVTRLLADSRFETVIGTKVSGIRRHLSGVDVFAAGGFHRHFDHVVLASHADQSLAMLQDPSPAERSVLEHFTTSENLAVLHRDPSFMPRARRFWSGWNYHGDNAGAGVSVTYWMNALQKLESSDQHFVTLNPQRAVADGMIDAMFTYRHPVFTQNTKAAQRAIWDIQGVQRTWFAGAWMGSGFHEDGLQAGLAVAEQLGGVRRPWDVPNESSRIHVGPVPSLPPLVQAAE